MYTLNLMDGTTISNLKRINPYTFEMDRNDSAIYFQLNDDNLCIAFLTEGDTLEGVYVDYGLQNWMQQYDGSVRFRINPWDEIHRESNREKRNKKRYEKEDKRQKRGEKK